MNFRKTLSAFALASTLLLGACTPGDLAGLIKLYCNIEPSIDDLAKIIIPQGANTEALLDAAARAFCQKAVAQAQASPKSLVAARRKGAVNGGVVTLRDAGGRRVSVRYTGTPRMR
jgi:hypothetical protein